MVHVLRSEVDPKPAIELGREVGDAAAPFAAAHDRDSTFAAEGYAAARESAYGAVAVPTQLGGGGHDLNAVCRAQAEIARSCASTALALAMHQHSVLTMAWRWASGDARWEDVLRRVATEHVMVAFGGPLHLTAASPVGEAVSGGFTVSGERHLCSGSPGADLMVCAVRVRTVSGSMPMRLLVPLDSAGVTVADDWHAMGMRGSGTNTVMLDEVFVPAEYAFAMEPSLDPAEGHLAGGRDEGLEHQPERPGHRGATTAGRSGASVPSNLFSPGLHISLPVIAATYLGAATAACDEALRALGSSPRTESPASHRLAGLMVSEATTGWWVLGAMLADTTDDSVGLPDQMITTLLGKRQIVLSAIRTAELAMELLGSMSYMASHSFERTLRDVRAGVTHPLSPEETLMVVGRAALGSPSVHPV